MANEFVIKNGYFSQGDSNVTGSLQVSGSIGVVGSGSDVLSVYGSQGNLLVVNDTFSGSIFTVTDISGYSILDITSDYYTSHIEMIGTASLTGSLSITQDITASKALFSSSNGDQLTVIGSGSTLAQVYGSQGNLLTVNDTFSGSIFTVTDISGYPILDITSDYYTGNLIVSGGFKVYEPAYSNTTLDTIGYLYDTNGDISIAWPDRILQDTEGDTSIDWEVRKLYANDSSTDHIDWSDPLYMNFPNTDEGSITRVLGMDSSNNVYWTSSTAFAGTNTTASFASSATWTFTHNLNSRYPIIQTLDSNFNQIVPQNIELTDANTATITFPLAISGYAIASLGGSNITQINNTASSVFATTGSNTFRGTQTFSGSLIPAGPYTNNTSSYDLGSATAAWRDLYVSNGSIKMISGSNSASIQFNNGAVTFAGASVTLPSSSTVPTASYVTPYEGAWTSYNVAWTTDGVTQPVIGNGTLTGYYKQIGKTIFVRVKLNCGSSTTFGTGTWQFGLPVTASNADGIQFPCSILDNGSAWYGGTVNGTYSGATFKSAIITPQPSTHTQAAVTATSPFTWGDTDSLQFNGSYEAA